MRRCGTLLLLAFLARTAAADVVCPESSYVTVSFACTFTGEYRTGEPFDTITIVTNNLGDPLASAGITIRVYVKNCQGQPIAGVPADAIVLKADGGCTCTGNIADGATDANGYTTFTGAVRGTGCGTSLTVRVDGVPIGTVPVRFNSPVWLACHFNFGDNLGFFASHLGSEAGDTAYSSCSDFNEDGYVDVTDEAMYAALFAPPTTCTALAAVAQPEEGHR